MLYKEIIKVPSNVYNQIEKYLTASCEEDYQDEDSTISYTAKFPNNIEMDVKCCGCQDEASWTEAVLFEYGFEVSCSEVEEEFLGTWTLEYEGNTYTAEVVVSD